MASRSFPGATTAFLMATFATNLSTFPYSMAGWFLSTSIDGDCTFCIAENTGSFVNRIVGQPSGALRFTRQDNIGSTDATTVNVVTNGVWHHCCIVCASATSARIILNGDIANQGSSATSRNVLSQNHFVVGRLNAGTPTNPYTGLAEMLAVWTAALSDHEIISLAAGLHPSLIRPANFKALHPFSHLALDKDIALAADFVINGAVTIDPACPPKMAHGIMPMLM